MSAETFIIEIHTSEGGGGGRSIRWGVGLLAGPSGGGGARGERACICPLRQTRQHIQRWLKPGMKMIDICEHLEGVARQLVEENGLKSGGGGAGGGAQVRWGGAQVSWGWV